MRKRDDLCQLHIKQLSSNRNKVLVKGTKVTTNALTITETKVLGNKIREYLNNKPVFLQKRKIHLGRINYHTTNESSKLRTSSYQYLKKKKC